MLPGTNCRRDETGVFSNPHVVFRGTATADEDPTPPRGRQTGLCGRGVGVIGMVVYLGVINGC